MRGTRFGSLLLLASALSAPRAQATVLDFNSLATNSSGGIAAGVSLIEDGYQLVSHFTTFYAFQDGWQGNRGSSNGTTTLMNFTGTSGSTLSAFTLSAVGGSAFNLISIELAELVNNGDFAFAAATRTYSFTGHVSGGGTVTSSFSIDLLSNGFGSPADFQTVLFSTAWQNLTFVDVGAFNASNPFGTYTNFDNIVVAEATAPVPEPATLGLLGVGLAGLRVARRRRA